MKTPYYMRRRTFLTGVAATATATAAQSAAPMLGPSMSLHRRFQLGSFEITTILSGTVTVNNDPQSIFGLNVSEDEFKRVCAENAIPDDKFQMFYTPTVINTGAELILFDTGQNPTGTVAALESAGYSADQVDKVVLTHFHGDHIGGISENDVRTFENAEYVCGLAEYEDWDFSGNETFEEKVRPLEDEIVMLENGEDIVTGVTAMAAHGHTPGHMGYMIESEGKNLFLGGDFANHYIWSLAYPDWELRFDRDREGAAQTRRRVLGMLEDEKMPFIGYHMPWPGLGYVETRGDGFRYVPASYQMML
jgi:glyoxylase-like metal-dependent hydrolase (beta-lactamase superfamily II)